MSLRVPHDNAWYGFTTLTGDWGALNFAGWIDSSFGRIETPPGDYPAYLVGAVYKGKLLMGGQSHQGRGTIFYTDGQWYVLANECFGVSPCAFSQDGRFFYAVTSASTGFWRDNETGQLAGFETMFHTDGIRAIIPPGNAIILGNTTNYSTRYDLHQYIDFENGLVVGQGADGAVVWQSGVRYLIEPGEAFFIRAMFDGHDIVFATVKQSARQLVTWALTVPELAQFPVSGGVEPITAINKPMHLGFFTGAPGAVGGWDTNDDPAGPPPPGNGKLDVPTFKYKLNDGRVLGTYITGGTVEEIEQRAAQCADIPVCYWDSRRWPRLPNLPAGSWLCVQAYRNASEPLNAFELDLRNILTQHLNERPNLKHVIVPGCYTSNASMTADLKSYVPVVSRLAASLRLHAIMPFSGSGRKTGLQDHPEARTLWGELFTTITGVPDEAQEPPPMGNGVNENGVLVDPELYWRTEIVAGEDPANYRDVYKRKQDLWFKYGQGSQNRSSCEPSSRLFLSHAGCRNVAPNPNDPHEMCLGVKQVPEAWESTVDTVENAPGTTTPVRWSWHNRMGPVYVPMEGTRPPIEPPIEPPIDPPQGEVTVSIYEYDKTFKRDPHDPNNWKGITVRFEGESALPIVESWAYLEDGERKLKQLYPLNDSDAVDGRYHRAVAFKPVVDSPPEGWVLRVRARNSANTWGESDGSHRVVVTS